MNDDLISRKSVLDYIEKEIATAKCTETISYLRALSVHINEYEPTAFDVDKVVEQLEELRDKANLDMLKNMNEPIPYSSTSNRMFAYDKAIEVVKAGGIDNVHK